MFLQKSGIAKHPQPQPARPLSWVQGVRLKMCFRTQLSVIRFSHVSVLYGQHDQ